MALDLVTYELGADERNRPRAAAITFMTPTRMRTRQPDELKPDRLLLPLVAAGVLMLVLIALVALKRLPASVFALYGFFSLLAFVAYGTDKAAAQKGAWRTSESTLHLMSLFGGWPGALLAQRVYHHKTRKQSFQLVFWGTVLLNCVMLALVATSLTPSPG